MEIAGYLMALIIGLSLGLIGSGGSILAVPVLAYLFLLDEKLSTAYSLFIVGITSLFGGLRQYYNKNIDWNTAFIFGIPAIVGVWIVRHYVVPALPNIFFEVEGFIFTRRMGMFGLFSIVMFLAAYSMLSNKENKRAIKKTKRNYSLILAEGFIVGAITGFIGAGGGFLIIPALVVLANLEIKKAIGTSLIIIAIKSLMGFLLGDAITLQIDWFFLLKFSTIALIGISIGIYIGKFIDNKKLKKGFGYFITLMSIFIFIIEFIIKK